MPNPLFNALNGQQAQNGGMSDFMDEFKRLQQTVKNPRQEVERLLQSGAMSQQDFNRLGQMANQMMGRK
ncbi:MAG: hypothetical protein J6R52_03695 [Alphaproteobacteria bacterium]|nr:hypothetical protein [Alphaproteobacteria bacterium]